ncbi:hypothetical protein SAMN05443247_06576 [Bradyrhizobium erythrophlei]|nr:hypothetical protein SAMN05443247_06576 [Bradyrhizobium erythrophlei]
MQYNQPWGVSDTNAPYINGNPSTGTMGSIPPAASIEYPQREIVAMIADAGITPSNADLTQLAKAIQSCFINYVPDTGTVNALNVTMSPVPAYRDGLVVRVKVSVNNTGPATINVNAQGAKKIRRKGDTDLLANDLAAGSIATLTYNSTLNGGAGAFDLLGAVQGGTTGPAGWLTANKDIYVDANIGNDANDGTDATAAHALRTMQHAVDIAFSYQPSQYAITIHAAAGDYNGTCQTPTWGGPHLYVIGAGATGATTSRLHAGNGYGFLCQGPGNWMDITGFYADNTVPNSGPALFTCGTGAYMHTHATASGNCGNGCFQVQGAGLMQVGGPHSFSGNTFNPFYVNIQGYMYIDQNAQFTITTPITVSQWANVGDLGALIVPSPSATFVNPGYVTGTKYSVFMNGCIDAQSLGFNYFPGTVAGVSGSGGQYKP